MSIKINLYEQWKQAATDARQRQTEIENAPENDTYPHRAAITAVTARVYDTACQMLHSTDDLTKVRRKLRRRMRWVRDAYETATWADVINDLELALEFGDGKLHLTSN